VAVPLLRLSVVGIAGLELYRVSNDAGFSCVTRGGVGFRMLVGVCVGEQQVVHSLYLSEQRIY
jgi:hypothetical protein